MAHEAVACEHHGKHHCKVQQVGPGAGQGARDHAQAGLEVQALQAAGDEQEDVDAIECVVPARLWAGGEVVRQLSAQGLCGGARQVRQAGVLSCG